MRKNHGFHRFYGSFSNGKVLSIRRSLLFISKIGYEYVIGNLYGLPSPALLLNHLVINSVITRSINTVTTCNSGVGQVADPVVPFSRQYEHKLYASSICMISPLNGLMTIRYQ